MIRRITNKGGALIAALLGAALPASVGAQAPIDTLQLRMHTQVLAHDSLLGRAAGSPGERVAAEYIAAQCSLLGLDPLGPGYIDSVPLAEARLLPETRLTVRTPGWERVFSFPAHVIPDISTRRTLEGFSGPAVWVGDHDLVDVDLEGRVAVVVGPARPGAVDTLAMLGAVGLIHFAPSDAAFGLYRQSRGERRLYHRDATVESSLLVPVPTAIVDLDAARAILSGDGPWRGVPDTPRMLRTMVELAIAAHEQPATSWNVGCVVGGADPALSDTAIAFTAHLDHLGVGLPDATGDSIYNGFSDNAAGVAMLLAIAEAAVSDTPPRHSWLFLFFGAEEQGLLGSDHYVHQPTWPLGRIRAVINLDAGAPPAPPVTWRLAGVDSLGLGATAVSVATTHGWKVTTSPPKPNSDYFPFIRRGVPAVFIIPGPGAYEGLSDDSSNALRRRWDRYHQLADEWHTDFPFAGLARYASFAYLVARRLDAEGRER